MQWDELSHIGLLTCCPVSPKYLFLSMKLFGNSQKKNLKVTQFKFSFTLLGHIRFLLFNKTKKFETNCAARLACVHEFELGYMVHYQIFSQHHKKS